MAAMMARSPLYESMQYPGTECHFANFTSLGACTVCNTEEIQINAEVGCTYYTYSNMTEGTSERKQYAELQPFKEAVTKGLNQTLDRYGMDCSREKEGFPTFAFNLQVPAKKSNTSLLQGMGVSQTSSSPKAMSSDAVFGNTYISHVTKGHNKTPFKGYSLRFCASGFGRDFGGNNGDFDTINTFTCLNTLLWPGPYDELDTFESFAGNLTRCRVSLCAQEYQKLVLFGNGTKQAESVTSKPLRKVGKNQYNDTEAVSDDTGSARFDIGPKSMSYLSQMLETVLYSKDFTEFLMELTASDDADWQTAFERVGDVTPQYIRSADNPDGERLPGKVVGVQTYFQVRWEWLVMPLIMVLVSIGFFTGTAIYIAVGSHICLRT